MTRQEHIDWCKQRALEYVKQGDLENAMASMLSDLRKHPDTRDHVAGPLMLSLFMNGHLKTEEEMTKFINGFN